MQKVLFVAGTRPEAIKLAPVIRYFRANGPEDVTTVVCSTGQHKEMLAQAFSDFDLVPDVELGVMTPGQTLSGLSSRLFVAVDDLLEREQPDWIVVQGDTTTVMIGSLAAFYRGVKVAHVEAGLRSGDRFHPFPEEVNRRIAGVVADRHFAPTVGARENLLREGVDPEAINTTGNTVIDALLWMVDRVREEKPALPKEIEPIVQNEKTYVLITGHRRESFGAGFQNICAAIRELARLFPDVGFVYPVHLNPNVRKPVKEILGDVPGVHLIEPQSYKPFVRLIDGSSIVLTDSGGIQEEAPSLGKPVLVMRDVTERPEGVQAGTTKLVGTDREVIVNHVSELLTNPRAYEAVRTAENPYGDGLASQRIYEILTGEGAAEPMGAIYG